MRNASHINVSGHFLIGGIMYDKPFLLFDQQLDKIEKEYLLNVNPREQSMNYLTNISYYTLINGYKECLMFRGTYFENLTLSDIFILHHFDVGLQTILFKYSLYVENSFKNKIAYIVSKNIGIDTTQYLDPNYYNKAYYSKDIKDTIENLEDVYKADYPKNPTAYYLKKHNHIPPWILFVNANFNDVIYIYKVLKSTDKDEATELVLPKINIIKNDKREIVIKMILIIKFYRNKIAHRLKFITAKPSEELPKTILNIFPEFVINEKEFNYGFGIRDIYAFILSIIVMIDEDALRINFLDELLIHLDSYSSSDQAERIYYKYLESAVLPRNLIERLTSLRKQIIDSIEQNLTSDLEI